MAIRVSANTAASRSFVVMASLSRPGFRPMIALGSCRELILSRLIHKRCREAPFSARLAAPRALNPCWGDFATHRAVRDCGRAHLAARLDHRDRDGGG